MTKKASRILTINGGSSSIRFSVYSSAREPQQLLSGIIDRIGRTGTQLLLETPAGSAAPVRIAATDHRAAAGFLLDWLEAASLFSSIKAVGHRVVHGMAHAQPARITTRLLAQLRRGTPYAPEHLPRELALIEAIRARHPRVPQLACFDTAFHRSMPPVARWVPVPRRYRAKGVQRYGFHGLSYAYVMEELSRLDPASGRGRVILAHLGNGASLAAVRNGVSVDTSMGFTPASGLVMGTRTGDVDPGLAYYLARTEGMSAAGFQRMVNQQSGLLGISGSSSDMRDLLAREDRDVRAKEAVALFCYQARKWIGAFAAVLGGVDALVFTGGIGENAAPVRERICDGLDFLGIGIDADRNAGNAPLISPDSERVRVRVIRTDEARMIARAVQHALGPIAPHGAAS